MKRTRNYWKNPQLFSEKFWDSLGKRELIECFLRSDITHVFNINNSPGSFYSINFNKEDHLHSVKEILNRVMIKYTELKKKERASKDAITIESQKVDFENWFQSKFPIWVMGKNGNTEDKSLKTPRLFGYKSLFPSKINATGIMTEFSGTKKKPTKIENKDTEDKNYKGANNFLMKSSKTSSSMGIEFICILNFEAASSIKSIALSGRNLSFI